MVTMLAVLLAIADPRLACSSPYGQGGPHHRGYIFARPSDCFIAALGRRHLRCYAALFQGAVYNTPRRTAWPEQAIPLTET